MISKAHTIKEQFGISMPRGSLYYPAAGNDMVNALMYSIDAVKEAHFSDMRQLVLPYPECGIKYLNSSMVSPETIELERKNRGIISKDMVIKARETISNRANYIKCVNNTLKEDFNSNTGTARFDLPRPISEIWTLCSGEYKTTDIQIHIYKMNPVLTLLGLQNISVFFYRRDLKDKDGIEQYWFTEGLFNLVLYKMVDGGLIVTNGSNMNTYPYGEDSDLDSFKSYDKTVKNFAYNKIHFEYIGKLENDDISKDTNVWQIFKR